MPPEGMLMVRAGCARVQACEWQKSLHLLIHFVLNPKLLYKVSRSVHDWQSADRPGSMAQRRRPCDYGDWGCASVTRLPHPCCPGLGRWGQEWARLTALCKFCVPCLHYFGKWLCRRKQKRRRRRGCTLQNSTKPPVRQHTWRINS